MQNEFEFFESLTRKLYEVVKAGDEYLQKVPDDIKPFVYENGFVNHLGLMNDILIEWTFGDLAEIVRWFLFEWTPDNELVYKTESGDIETCLFNNEDEFYSFVNEKYYS